jgi:hypothetical protein
LFIPNGKKLIYHNGWWHGNRTVFIRMLDENATIIALSNNDYRNVYAAKRLCDLFGDYRQGHESFDEGEIDSTDPGPGGEPREEAGVTASPAGGPAVVATHPVVHHRARRRSRRVTVKKKPVQTPAR